MPNSHLPFRPGVGVVLFDRHGRVLVGRRVRRVGDEVWQFPQGGLDPGESPLDGAYRELEEEIGTRAATLIAEMPDAVEYDIPDDLTDPPRWATRYRGQRQRWFAMRFTGTDDDIRLDTGHPEFDAYRWIPLDEAVELAVDFKRDVYRQVGEAFAPLARVGSAIEVWRRIISGQGSSWILFEHGTCVVLSQRDGDPAERATALLREWGPVRVGTPSADFDLVELDDHLGWLVTCHHPDILSHVSRDELGDAAPSEIAVGLLGRAKRDHDAHDLHVVHVEDRGGLNPSAASAGRP
jgi:putative (di)nucleoside polyphosphate hydrolase